MTKEGIHLNGLYKHYKGNFYRVEQIAYSHEDQSPVVIYQQVNQHGVYISHRNKDGSPKVKQPFYRSVKEFRQFVNVSKGFWKNLLGIRKDVERFKFIKYL